MVKKTTSFKKGKGKKGNFKKNGKQVAAPVKKPKARPKPQTSPSIASELATRSGTAPSTWHTRGMAMSKVYLIYMLLMCTLQVLVVAPGYLILVRLLIFVTQNKTYGIKWRLAKDKVMMCVGSVSKVDVITIARSLYRRDQ